MKKTRALATLKLILPVLAALSLAACFGPSKPGELVLGDGWYNLERSGADGNWWVWTKNKGQIIVKSDKDIILRLTGEVGAIQMPNKVDVSVNGKKTAVLEITGEKREQKPFEPLEVELYAGGNTIEFTSHNPPIKIPTDARELAIAVSNLKLVYSDGRVAFELEKKSDK